MTINFFALFGENSYQTPDTLTIDKSDLGLAPGANTAESILVALWLRLFRLASDAIAIEGDPLTIEGEPIEIIDPSNTLTAEIDRAKIIYQRARLDRVQKITISIFDNA
jgi:hypothetical protein